MLTLLLAALAQQPQPDIVVILADDMGYSDIGCYGGEIETPHLDALAASGVRMTQFYNAARCCPTRASLMSGVYPHQAGVGWMMSDNGTDAYRGELSPRVLTIAEALRPAGYGTYMSGKWHLTKGTRPGDDHNNWPHRRGFDRHFGTIHGAGSFYDPNSLVEDGEYLVPGEGFYYTDAITDHAVEYIDGHATVRPEDPLFLYVAYTAPHWPMHALPEDIAKYEGRYDAGWDALRDERLARMRQMGLLDGRWDLTPRDAGVPAWSDADDREWHAARMEVYAAMVDRMDQGIGRILGALEERGRLDNTLVLFLADNGGCAEEYGSSGDLKLAGRPASSGPVEPRPMGDAELQMRMEPHYTRDGRPVRTGRGVTPGPDDTYVAYGKGWANASNTPFRLYKHWVHEGGIATPLIAHWPRVLHRAGALEVTPGHLVDVMATCLDAAGAAYPDADLVPLEGRSLLPALRGEATEKRPLFFEHEGHRAVRLGDLKLVAQGATGPWELYDLAADRTELHDLAAFRPRDVAHLAELWEEWAERAGVLPLVPYWAKKEEALSTATTFRLKGGDELARADSPNVRMRPFHVRLSGRADERSGVLVAHGGSSHGWALHLDEGVPVFSLRRSGDLAQVRADRPLRGARFVLEATLGVGGELALVVDDGRGPRRFEAEGIGLLTAMPGEGLEVGRDAKGAVAPHVAPAAIDAELDVVITLFGG